MTNQIVYNREELESVKNNLNDSLNILKNDIESSLNSDFSVLEELGLFSNGLSKIKKQTSSLGESHTSLINKLSRHADDYQQQQQADISLLDRVRGGGTIGGSRYSGDALPGRDDEKYEKEDGMAIKTSYLSEVVPQLSVESKLQMLKNILIYNTNPLTALFAKEEYSNILIYQLRKMLKDETATQSELALDPEKKLQKTIIESIAKEEKNLFLEVDEKTYLAGLSFYKKVALENNLNVSDLLIDTEQEELLMKSFNELYFNSSISGVPEEEIKRVKEYFDELSKLKKISVEEMLSDIKYMDVIKEGVINDSKSQV